MDRLSPKLHQPNRAIEMPPTARCHEVPAPVVVVEGGRAEGAVLAEPLLAEVRGRSASRLSPALDAPDRCGHVSPQCHQEVEEHPGTARGAARLSPALDAERPVWVAAAM